MRCLSGLVFLLLSYVANADVSVDYRTEYEPVQLVEFVKSNQISQRMIDNKQRLMKQPKAIQFEGWAMSVPKPGKFELVYDALKFWSSPDDDMLEVDHSAYVTAEAAPVLSVYVTHSAAESMKNIGVKNKAVFYALHIYTYAKGPRLLIIAVEPHTSVDG